jgi:UDP-GlcNAc3NAcA epimerase
MKIVTIVGARPQFIKAAVVSRALRSVQEVQEVLVHTGQHYDDNMSAVFFEELEIAAPDYHLGIGSGNHGQQTGRMLEAIELVLQQEAPDQVLVYGDTNSTLAGALAASKLHIRVAHVEAGLRSFNKRMPEEINRILTDHVSDLLLAPTAAAVQNLEREGIADRRVHLVGDVMYDAALYYAQRAAERSRILETRTLSPGGYILATIHRAENTDDPTRLAAIVAGLSQIAQECPIVLPLHPRTQGALERTGLHAQMAASVSLLEPVGYLDMAQLEKNARVIVTDSGGVQKEAYFYRVPCVTLRAETEWVELVAAGWVHLVTPDDAARVVEGVRAVWNRPADRTETPGLYGGGHSAERIGALLAGGAQ